MPGVIDEQTEREYHAERQYYTAWLDHNGEPVIEDYSDESHELHALVDLAWEWQLDWVGIDDDDQIVIVRGRDAKEIVFTVWRAEAHRLEHEDDAEKAHDAYCQSYYGGDCSAEVYARAARRGDRL